jgi:hypothetical protein
VAEKVKLLVAGEDGYWWLPRSNSWWLERLDTRLVAGDVKLLVAIKIKLL